MLKHFQYSLNLNLHYMFNTYPHTHFHTTTIISLRFREWFTRASDIYKRLGQFDYGQPSWASDHISTCFEGDLFNSWIYIGEVKEGTDDTPHGISIQVNLTGYTHISTIKSKIFLHFFENLSK